MMAAPDLTRHQDITFLAGVLARAFLNAVPDPAWIKDREGRYVAVNAHFKEICTRHLGRADVNIVGATDFDLLPAVDAERAQEEERAITAAGGAARSEWVIHCADGDVCYLDVHRIALLTDNGQVAGSVGFARDITEKAVQAWQLRESERVLATLVRNLPGVAYRRLNDAEWSMEFVSAGCSELTGYPPEEFVGNRVRTWSSTIAPEDLERVWHEIQRQLEKGVRYAAEYRIVRADGTLRWVSERGGATGGDGVTGELLDGIVTDITDTRYYLEEMVHRTTHDTLTGVANRPLLVDHLRHGMAYGQRYKSMVATLVINIDHFKYVNQSLGHDAGDLLLVETASRLRKVLREHDTVARLGADSFAMVLMDLDNLGGAAQVMTRVLAAVREPAQIGSEEVVVTCSIGCTLFPVDGKDAETLLRRADTAMRRARNLGGDCYHFYSEESDRKTEERLHLETHLRRAVERGELVLQYQPQLNLRDGTLLGAEALVRWKNPELGMVSPARFIPIAEETDLIITLGSWVIEEACRWTKALLDDGLSIGHVAVNLSARQFREPGLIERIRGILEHTGLAPVNLELEITESLVMRDVDAVVERLRQLKTFGVQLAIDDFGTGYSSLSYLRRFPIDRLKIDQSFTREVTSSSDGAAIARAVIQLGHALDLRVIAEGVETEGQLTFMRDNGCDEAQGYFYAPPLDADAFRKLLAAGAPLQVAG